MTDVPALSLSMLLQAAEIYAGIFQFDLSRYLIGAGGVFLVVNVLLARWLQGRKIRNKTPGGAQMRREFFTSIRTVAIFASVGLSIFALRSVGLIDVYMNPAERGWGYFIFSLIAFIILHDAWFYWTHRLIHDPRLFRRFHRTHHKSHNPSPWTAYSFDVGEAFINAIYMPLALLIIPAAPLAVFLFLGHMMLRNAIGHSGYEIFPSNRNGRPVFDWITSVTHHDLHHAQAGWNYGLYFTWWDRMMGTEHPLYHEKFAAAVRRPLDGSAVAAIGANNKIPDMLIAVIFLFAAGVVSIAPPSSAIAEDNTGQSVDASIEKLAGVWATAGHGAHVRLAACEENTAALCGRMIWSWNPELEEKVDGYLLGDFVQEGVEWVEGWLANPEDGRTYRGKIKLLEDGSLKLKGCTLIFCRSQIWRCLEDVPGCKAADLYQEVGLRRRISCCPDRFLSIV